MKIGGIVFPYDCLRDVRAHNRFVGFVLRTHPLAMWIPAMVIGAIVATFLPHSAHATGFVGTPATGIAAGAPGFIASIGECKIQEALALQPGGEQIPVFFGTTQCGPIVLGSPIR
jgi:hypothetical protein